jgi:hypothetical protein
MLPKPGQPLKKSRKLLVGVPDVATQLSWNGLRVNYFVGKRQQKKFFS